MINGETEEILGIFPGMIGKRERGDKIRWTTLYSAYR